MRNVHTDRPRTVPARGRDESTRTNGMGHVMLWVLHFSVTPRRWGTLRGNPAQGRARKPKWRGWNELRA